MPDRISFWVEGRPRPKERPRVVKGRAFTPRTTTDAEKAIGQAFKDAGGERFDGPVRVTARLTPEGQHVLIERADHSSKLRGDIDNYLKTLLDGLEKADAFNDICVVDIEATKS